MMIRIILTVLTGFIYFFATAQIQTDSHIFPTKDTLNSFGIKKNPPFIHCARFNNQEARLGNKFVRGTLFVVGYNITMGSYLLIAPEYITNWDKSDKFKSKSILNQYKKSFTSAPVFDRDLWYVNYIGHPYQGSFYYNSMRSQNASILHSTLFCIGQSLLWEYGWEAGMEQPSIQDLLSTPVTGILIGELSHIATVKLAKNGFRWYEVALVCMINPAFAINNGFKSKRFNHK